MKRNIVTVCLLLSALPVASMQNSSDDEIEKVYSAALANARIIAEIKQAITAAQTRNDESEIIKLSQELDRNQRIKKNCSNGVEA